jgi:preprotein translocase subunit SecE
MTEQAQASGASALDVVKLVAAVAILVGGVAGFYVLDQYPEALRWLIVLVAVALGIFVALQSAQGRELAQYVQGSRVELRKVVWPTREETNKMTVVVFVAIVVMALFFWLLDAGLGWITRSLTGQGS